jgi:tetratricopeptide (TPR) repeat protein
LVRERLSKTCKLAALDSVRRCLYSLRLENLVVLHSCQPRFPALSIHRHLIVRLLTIALLIVPCLIVEASTQAARSPSMGRDTESVRPSSVLDVEIQHRLSALATAKRGTDADSVKAASRFLAASGLRQMGYVLAELGQYSQAEDAYGRSVEFEEEAQTHLELCMVYLQQAKPDDCLSETSKVILNNPQNAAAWRVQSKAYAIKNDTAHAASSLHQADALPKDASKMPAALNAPAKLSVAQRLQLKKRQSELSRIIADALNDLGTTEAREGRYALSLDHLHEAEHWQTSLPGLQRNIGFAADRVGDYPEVVRALRKVIAEDPNDRLARTILGTALYSTHDFAAAVQTFAQLGDPAIDEPGVAYAWADSLVKLNRFHEAGTLLNKLEQRPQSADMFILIAQARSQMGDYSHAVESCRRAIAADPQILKAHYIAGLALLREGQSAEAESELKSELAVDPNSVETQYNLAFVLLQQSRPQEAVPWLEKVVAQDPNHAQANYELGKQLQSDGKTADAVRFLEVAARLSPQMAHVHYQLQSAYRALGRRDDADRELRMYKEIKEKNRTPGGSETKP